MGASGPVTLDASLRELLAEHDLCEDAAASIAGEVSRDYPLVSRLGVEAMARRIAACGATPDSARGAALTLLAFELLGRAGFDEAVTRVRGCAPEEAVGACLRAARLRRSLRSGDRVAPARRPRTGRLRAALDWLR